MERPFAKGYPNNLERLYTLCGQKKSGQRDFFFPGGGVLPELAGGDLFIFAGGGSVNSLGASISVSPHRKNTSIIISMSSTPSFF